MAGREVPANHGQSEHRPNKQRPISAPRVPPRDASHQPNYSDASPFQSALLTAKIEIATISALSKRSASKCTGVDKREQEGTRETPANHIPLYVILSRLRARRRYVVGVVSLH